MRILFNDEHEFLRPIITLGVGITTVSPVAFKFSAQNHSSYFILLFKINVT